MNILRRIPRSLLLVLQPEKEGAKNIRAEAAAHGITERLLFIPKVCANTLLGRFVLITTSNLVFIMVLLFN
jgi:predicted O-linked N-acetylglucosamine transferase (SPINDLY family)